MKTLLNLILLIPLLTYSQIPDTADSIYWSTKYCDTAETFEEHLTQWVWNGNVINCVQPSEQFANAFYDEETGEVDLYLLDSYDCCCKVASTPGVVGAWNFFYGSPCQTYLDSIGFIYDDPGYVNSVILDEIDLELKGIYIDIYGRKYTSPPKGLSIMNGKKYYKF